MTGYDPQLRAALDGFTVPPMRAELAAEIVRAAAGDRSAPVRRDRRGAWRRGRTLLGASALLLVSATAAAAAGLFGQWPARVPVLSQVIAAIAPEPVARPAVAVPKPAPPRRAAAARPPLPRATPAPIAPEPAAPLPAAPVRRWLAVREARVAAGLPVRPLPARVQLRLKRAAERRAFVAEHPQAAARIVEQSRFAVTHPAAAARVAERLRARAPTAPAAIEPGDRDVPVAPRPDRSGDHLRQSAPEAPLAVPARAVGLERLRMLRQLRAQRQALRQSRRR